MTNIPNFIKEINRTNSTNDKIETLKSYKNDKLVQRVLTMCYDKIQYTYGVTMKNVKAGISEGTKNLSWGLDQLERLNSREVTGNAAIALVEEVLEAMNEEDRIVIERILGRDLKINMGTTNINKVIKGLITKQVYMRCDVGRPDKSENGKLKKGTFRNITYPAQISLKADGTFRQCYVSNESSFTSRSAESYFYPQFEEVLNKSGYNGYLHGEMTVILDDDLLNKILPKLEKADKKNGTNNAEEITKNYLKAKEEGKEFILNRSIGNGLLNSDNVPQNNIVFDVWDFVSEEDYQLAGLKDKKNLPKQTLKERFEILKELVKSVNHPRIRVIEHKEVNSLPEAMKFVQEKMEQGLEGGILKDYSNIYKDGTSKTMLKLKLQIDMDARVTGFIEGTKGTKREKTFGSITFENEEGTIKGSVSGFSDAQLEEINSNREAYIGKIICIEFNDISKALNHDYYALSHPRFIEFRDDKNETDTLERVFEMKEMAMNLSEK